MSLKEIREALEDGRDAIEAIHAQFVLGEPLNDFACNAHERILGALDLLASMEGELAEPFARAISPSTIEESCASASMDGAADAKACPALRKAGARP